MSNDSLVGTIAEEAVIGALLRYPGEAVVGQILSMTEVDDFETPPCRAIRFAALDLPEDGFDLTTIAGRLEQNGDLDSVVTGDFLRRVVENAPVPVAVQEHLNSLKTYRAARQITLSAKALVEDINSSKGNSDRLSEAVEESVVTINDSLVGVGTHGWQTIGQTVNDLINKDHSGPSEFVSTGIGTLDDALGGGLGLGTITTVAARPGFGKSALSLHIMREATLAGIPSALFSLEMGYEEVTSRFLGGAAKINHRALRKGEYTETERERIVEWGEKLQNAPAYIDTRDTVGPQDIIGAFARFNADAKMKYGTGIQLLVLDYLQLMTSARRFPSREQEVSHYMREVTKLAKREQIAVIVVAQLNRGDKNRDVEHRPSVKDLRESGAIEQDSDVVLLLAKPEDEDDSDHPRGGMDIIIGKNRNGPLQDIPVTFLAQYPTFEERDAEEEKDDWATW